MFSSHKGHNLLLPFTETPVKETAFRLHYYGKQAVKHGCEICVDYYVSSAESEEISSFMDFCWVRIHLCREQWLSFDGRVHDREQQLTQKAERSDGDAGTYVLRVRGFHEQTGTGFLN